MCKVSPVLGAATASMRAFTVEEEGAQMDVNLLPCNPLLSLYLEVLSGLRVIV